MTVKLRRRDVMWAGCLLGIASAGILGANQVFSAGGPRLYVFVPTLMRTSALVALLEEALKGVQITVFGRFADFQSAVNSKKPDAAISLGAGLEAAGLRVNLQGQGATGPREPYVVLTNRKDLQIQQLGDATLGVVDVVGRRALPSLIQQLLHLPSAPRVRRVLKLADLLPLLSLKLADGIVIPQRLLSDFTSASRLPLTVLAPKTATLERTAIAFPYGKVEPQIQKGIERLSADALRTLGVQGWVSVR